MVTVPTLLQAAAELKSRMLATYNTPAPGKNTRYPTEAYNRQKAWVDKVQWLLNDANGQPSDVESRRVATILAYNNEYFGILKSGGKSSASYTSNHMRGTAIDCTFQWASTIKVQAGVSCSAAQSKVTCDLSAVSTVPNLAKYK